MFMYVENRKDSCLTIGIRGLVFDRKCCNGDAVFGKVGAEARICEKRWSD